nr:hypothetical protein CFP56_51237 [Quercus suber]
MDGRLASEMCSLEADWSSSSEDFMRVSVLDGSGFEHIYMWSSPDCYCFSLLSFEQIDDWWLLDCLLKVKECGDEDDVSLGTYEGD